MSLGNTDPRYIRKEPITVPRPYAQVPPTAATSADAPEQGLSTSADGSTKAVGVMAMAQMAMGAGQVGGGA